LFGLQSAALENQCRAVAALLTKAMTTSWRKRLTDRILSWRQLMAQWRALLLSKK